MASCLLFCLCPISVHASMKIFPSCKVRLSFVTGGGGGSGSLGISIGTPACLLTATNSASCWTFINSFSASSCARTSGGNWLFIGLIGASETLEEVFLDLGFLSDFFIVFLSLIFSEKIIEFSNGKWFFAN